MICLPPRRSEQRGAATVTALSLLSVLMLAAFVAAGAVALVAGHRKAQSAADLAALAAAQALQRGDDPCTAGREIASAQNAALTGCSVEGSEVVVIASVHLSSLLGGSSLEGRARAGPSP